MVETTYWSDSQFCLAGLKSTNQNTENFCSQPSEHDQQLQMQFLLHSNGPPSSRHRYPPRRSQPKESRQQLWWHGPSLKVLKELKTTHQDISELLKNAVFILRKQEERTECKPEDTLDIKTQQIGPHTARPISPEDTLNTDHTHRSNRIAAIHCKIEDALFKDNLHLPELTEKMIDHSGTFKI